VSNQPSVFGRSCVLALGLVAAGLTQAPISGVLAAGAGSRATNVTKYTVTNYTSRPGIDAPDGITRGPDGALWFTDTLGSTIGRIHSR
jgi:streptogramin lyase